MVMCVKEHSTNVKISIEIEKTRPILNELLQLGDVVFVSKEFSQFSGFRMMDEACQGFLGLTKQG